MRTFDFMEAYLKFSKDMVAARKKIIVKKDTSETDIQKIELTGIKMGIKRLKKLIKTKSHK